MSINNLINNGICDIVNILCCFSHISKIKTEVGYKLASELSIMDKVYSINKQAFINIENIHKITARKTIYKIPKDLFGINQPFEDFYITGGHKLLINEREVKVKNLLHETITKIKKYNGNVYTLQTKHGDYIDINGLGVKTKRY